MLALDLARSPLAYLLARARYGERDQAGLTTTEIAVLSALLVGGAIVVATMIYTAAKSNAANIPEPELPTGP